MLKEFAGAAPRTTIVDLLPDTHTGTFNVTNGSGYPTGSTAPFVIVLNRGSSLEEKVLISSRAGNVFTIQQRGYDGTIANSHDPDTTVHHILDSVTIAEMNEHANDASTHLPPGGSDGMSLVKQSAADYDAAWELISGGEGGESQLISGGTALKGALAYANANLSLPTGSVVALPMTEELFDTDGFHDSVTNNNRLTVPAGMGGKYLVSWNSSFSPAASGTRDVNVRKNGSIYVGSSTMTAQSSNVQLTGSSIVDLVPGDYIEILYTQNSGGTISTTTSGTAANRPWNNSLALIYLDKSIGAGGLVGTRVKRGADQTIPTGVYTAIQFTGEDFDSDAFHDNTTNNTRITIPPGKSGKYLINAQALWAATDGSSYDKYLAIRKNGGGDFYGFDSIISGVTNRFQTNRTTVVLDLVAGDYIEAVVRQGSGTDKAISLAGTDSNYLEAIWLEGLYTPARPAGSSFKGVKAYATVTQGVPNSSTYVVALAGEFYDTDGFHDNVTNNNRLTVPPGMGGKYLISAQGSFAPHATGYRTISIRKNGSISLAFAQHSAVATGAGEYLNCTIVADLIPGDYVELTANQNSGTTLDLNGTTGEWGANLALVYLDKSVGSGGSVGVKAYPSANVSLPHNSTLFVPLNTEAFDTDGFHDNVTNPERFTIPAGKSGKYLLNAWVTIAASSAGTYRQIQIAKIPAAGGNVTLARQTISPAGAFNPALNISIVADLQAGDSVVMGAAQDSGSTINLVGNAFDTGFEAIWLEGLTTDHGALSGLADDDHPQYMKKPLASKYAKNGGNVSGTATPARLTNIGSLTFTAPANGQITWEAEFNGATSGSAGHCWVFLDNGTAEITGDGYSRRLLYGIVSETVMRASNTVTGLTPGQSYTWFLGVKTNGPTLSVYNDVADRPAYFAIYGTAY